MNNPITLEAFRNLIKDLFRLFLALNEGIIAILDKYFDMSKPDASTSISLYKEFTEITVKVTSFCQTAKMMEGQLNMKIPNLIHAPVSLIETLQDYLINYDEGAVKKVAEVKKETSSRI